MGQSNTPKLTLRSYLDDHFKNAFYIGIVERYLLAQRFMEAFRETWDKHKKGALECALFYDLTNISIQPEKTLQEDGIPRYGVILPTPTTLSSGEVYDNYEFGHRNLLFYPNGHDASSRDAIQKARGDKSGPIPYEAYTIHTIAVILFHIYFCKHPLRGRLYPFKDVVEAQKNNDKNRKKQIDKRFFKEEQPFMFAGPQTLNGPVPGRHDEMQKLWDCLSHSQQQFWRNAMKNEGFSRLEAFFDEWKRAYGGLSISYTPTACGELLPTLISQNKDEKGSDFYQLITSDTCIGEKRLPVCAGCVKKRADDGECAKCPHAQAEVRIPRARLQLIPRTEGTFQSGGRYIWIYAGHSIYSDVLGGKEDKTELFRVVASTEKQGVLGLRCCSDGTVTATYNGVRRAFVKDSIIPLYPDVEIVPFKGSMIRVVPSDRPSDGGNSSDGRSDPTPGSDPEGQKKTNHPGPVNESSPQRSMPESTSNSGLDGRGGEAAGANTYVCLKGRVYRQGERVSLQEDTEHEVYRIYPESGSGDSVFLLTVLKKPVDEKENAAQEERLKQMSKVQREFSYQSICLRFPCLQIDLEGDFNGRRGYVTQLKLPAGGELHRFTEVACDCRDDELGMTLEKKLRMLISMCKGIDTLHGKNYVYGALGLSNIQIDVKNGQCYIINNDRIWERRLPKEHISSQFRGIAAPEFHTGYGYADKYMDLFSFAVVLFMTLYHMHPFDRYPYGSEKNNEISQQDRYVGNPQFIFSGRISDSVRADCPEAVALWDRTPDEVQRLFQKVFYDSVKQRDSGKEVRSIRIDRPSMEEWTWALDQWKKGLNP